MESSKWEGFERMECYRSPWKGYEGMSPQMSRVALGIVFSYQRICMDQTHEGGMKLGTAIKSAWC